MFISLRRWRCGVSNWIGLAVLLCLTALALWPHMAFAQNAAAQVVIDPTFRTPAPPNDAFPQNAEHVYWGTLGMLIAGAIATVIVLRDAIRLKTTVPIGLVFAAAVCVYPECIDNYLAGCYWSQSHDPDKLLYFLMGREFDYYVTAMWWAFGVILGYIFYFMLLRNFSTGKLWIGFALSGVADIIIEEILLRYGGIYRYFGHQPLVLLGHFPWWWLFVNVSALYLGVAITYRFRDWLNGWKSVFVLGLIPLCYIGGFSFSALPTIYVIQGDFSPFVTNLAGVASCILALIATMGVFHFVLGRNPLHFERREEKGFHPTGTPVPA